MHARPQDPGADGVPILALDMHEHAHPMDRSPAAGGHDAGRATALRLRAAGVNARHRRGGIDGWQSAPRPLVDKPAAPTS